MIDVTSIKDSITAENVVKILGEYGAVPFWETMEYIVFPTICHNVNVSSASPKLYYYKDTKKFYCFSECQQSYDLISLIMQVEELRGNKPNFYDVIRYICDKIDYEFNYENGEEEYRSNRNYYSYGLSSLPFSVYDSNVLNFFSDKCSEQWLTEGITQQIHQKYGIKWYNWKSQIVIPHYSHDEKLVGIRVRSLDEEEMRLGKYRPLFLQGKRYNHPLSQFCYGLWVNGKNIQDTHRAIVVEGEKSVYKGEYLPKNNVVAVCGSNLSKQQILHLINSGAREIVLGFDKEYGSLRDKESEVYFNKLWQLCKRYSAYCTFSFMYDFDDLLGKKQSPLDNGVDVYNELMSKRVRVK